MNSAPLKFLKRRNGTTTDSRWTSEAPKVETRSLNTPITVSRRSPTRAIAPDGSACGNMAAANSSVSRHTLGADFSSSASKYLPLTTARRRISWNPSVTPMSVTARLLPATTMDIGRSRDPAAAVTPGI